MSDRSPGRRTLARRIRRWIAENGPITFADFMDCALYDPEDGFFTRGPIGEAGDFVTSPHVSAAFGVLVSRQIEEFWSLLEKPNPFHVVEAGAGDGTLAGQVLEFMPSALREVTRYVAVERTEAARRAMDGGELSVAGDLEEVPRHLVGCVVANEVLDNVPFHRIRRRGAKLVELYVVAQGSGFALVEGLPSSDELVALAPHDLADGAEAVVSPGALRFVDQAAAVLDRGYIWLIDYGFAAGDRASIPHGYRSHRLEADVLEDPGSRDITAGVDFERLAEHARRAGHVVWGPVTQREALRALGYRGLDEEARERQVRAAAEGRGLEANRIYSARSRATMLVDPDRLGGFLVLCVGVGVEVPPSSARRVG